MNFNPLPKRDKYKADQAAKLLIDLYEHGKNNPKVQAFIKARLRSEYQDILNKLWLVLNDKDHSRL